MHRLALILLLLSGVFVSAQEVVTPTTPITHPNVVTLKIDRIVIDATTSAIYIQWLGNTGETFSANYPTPAPTDHASQPTGATLLHTINTANFSVTSLSKRIFQQLQADGYIGAGTISGTPQ